MPRINGRSSHSISTSLSALFTHCPRQRQRPWMIVKSLVPGSVGISYCPDISCQAPVPGRRKCPGPQIEYILTPETFFSPVRIHLHNFAGVGGKNFAYSMPGSMISRVYGIAAHLRARPAAVSTVASVVFGAQVQGYNPYPCPFGRQRLKYFCKSKGGPCQPSSKGR
jgi:hypothetical protein